MKVKRFMEGAAGALASGALKRRGLPVGTPAPNLTLPDLSGSQQGLAEYRGKRLLLVFSDPDCGPCQQLAPELARLHQQHRANDLEVVMISRGGAEANATKAAEHGIAFPILLQQHWEACKRYSVIALPTGYLIDKRGAVASDAAIGPEEILRLV